MMPGDSVVEPTVRAWSFKDVGSTSLFRDAVEDRDVFIIGAGFSRAVSELMPLTDELGNACLSLVPDWSRRGIEGEFQGGRFETFLSELASDQPYLSDTENLYNKARFASFSEAIASIIGKAQEQVLRVPAPAWLASFMTTAHHCGSTLMTFNYDCLLECVAVHPSALLTPASERLDSYDEIDWNGVLTGDIPPWPPGPARFGGTPLDTLRIAQAARVVELVLDAG